MTLHGAGQTESVSEWLNPDKCLISVKRNLSLFDVLCSNKCVLYCFVPCDINFVSNITRFKIETNFVSKLFVTSYFELYIFPWKVDFFLFEVPHTNDGGFYTKLNLLRIFSTTIS